MVFIYSDIMVIFCQILIYNDCDVYALSQNNAVLFGVSDL